MTVAPETVAAISLPPREAISFLAQKVNVTTTHWTDVWRTGHSRAFMVAGAATEALVADFRDAVTRAIEQGRTPADFRRDFDDIVRRNGWQHNGSAAWRANLIYDVNLSMAYSAGRWAQQTRPEVLAAFPFLQYQHSGAAHPRKQHLAWNGLVLRADDPWWQTHYPPNGWRCGCRARSRSARDLARMGKAAPDRAPEVATREWTNPRTGERSQVPEGVDPGFDYNPGSAWRGGSLPEIPGTATLTPPPGWMPEPPPIPPARPARPPRRPAEAGDDQLVSVPFDPDFQPDAAASRVPPPPLPLGPEDPQLRANLLVLLRRLAGRQRADALAEAPIAELRAALRKGTAAPRR